MRRWISLLPIALLLSPAAGATEYELEANLLSPANERPWINIADCEELGGDDEGPNLRLGWALPAGLTATWLNPQEADVFISSSETCSAVTFEIGEVAETGSDVTIEEGQVEGEFPVLDVETYTLADLIDDSEFDCAGSTEGDHYLCLTWEFTYTNQVGNDVTDSYYAAAELRIDLMPPGMPTLEDVEPGEENLKVYWTEPGDDDVAGYVIYWREAGAGDDAWQNKTEAGENADNTTITGLTNGTSYEVTVAAYDQAENEGLAADPPQTETPTPIQDGFEHYREAGGSEQGGFCFVATAAYGAYDHGLVRELRGLRDEVLAPTAAGRAFVDAYYRFGPRWARAIRHHDTARGAARWALAPLAGLAAMRHAGPAEWLLLAAALLLAGWLLLRLRRWLAAVVRRAGPAGLALAIGLAALGADPAARAQQPRPLDSGETLVAESIPNHQLQLRFGPYYPAVDSESGLSGEPFKEIYGSGSELLFEIGYDWQIWRGFGAVSAGASFGFVQYLGKGLTSAGAESSDTTTFNLVPLRLTAGYHFTKLYDWWHVPLVPYVQGGLSYYIWWSTDGVGDVSKWNDPEGGSDEALGGIFGLHLGVGLKLLLDWLDESAALGFEEQTGVINTFLFAEYEISWVDGFGAGGHMPLGDETFMFGLMFEF